MHASICQATIVAHEVAAVGGRSVIVHIIGELTVLSPVDIGEDAHPVSRIIYAGRHGLPGADGEGSLRPCEVGIHIGAAGGGTVGCAVGGQSYAVQMAVGARVLLRFVEAERVERGGNAGGTFAGYFNLVDVAYEVLVHVAAVGHVGADDQRIDVDAVGVGVFIAEALDFEHGIEPAVRPDRAAVQAPSLLHVGALSGALAALAQGDEHQTAVADGAVHHHVHVARLLGQTECLVQVDTQSAEIAAVARTLEAYNLGGGVGLQTCQGICIGEVVVQDFHGRRDATAAQGTVGPAVVDAHGFVVVGVERDGLRIRVENGEWRQEHGASQKVFVYVLHILNALENADVGQ